MKPKLTTFAIFCNRIIGEKKKAINFQDLMDNRMSKRHEKFWSNIKFQDVDGNSINIEREFLDQGMTFNEIVEDFKTHNPEQLNDIIHTI